MSVKIVRLINSEEIIGHVEINESGNFVIKDGAIIIPAGEGKMALVPWLPHSKEDSIEILSDRVLYSFEPLTELANEYNSRLGNGLVIPPPAMSAMGGLKISGD